MSDAVAATEDADEDAQSPNPFDMSRAAVFAPIQTMSTFEETVERLMSAVRLGVFAAGERLPSERELAAQLQVSRLTLREAVRALRLSGHFKTRRGRYGGTFVSPDATSPERAVVSHDMATRLEDVLVFRRVLEMGTVEAAAGVPHEQAEIDHLERCLVDCEKASGRAAFHRTDSRLHLAFAEMTRSPSLVSSATDMRRQLNVYLEAIPALEWNVSNAHLQHRQITEALIAGNVTKARRTMDKHLHGTESLLRGFFGESPPA
ncbi:FadR/GntR family transcriptional regulator [Rhodococcus koreensis]